LRSVNDGKATNAGLLAIVLAKVGHPGTVPVTSSIVTLPLGRFLVMPGLGGCEGEEKAVVVGDIFSDPELDVAGSLGSVSVQIWTLIL